MMNLDPMRTINTSEPSQKIIGRNPGENKNTSSEKSKVFIPNTPLTVTQYENTKAAMGTAKRVTY